MSKLAGMLQIIGAGVGGYMQGKRMQERDAEAKAERESDRAFQNEQRERQRSEWSRQDQVRDTIKQGQSDVAIEELPGQSDYNIESMGGVGVPTGAPKPPPAGFQVAGETFADRSAAEMAAKGLNTKLGRTKRTVDGLNALGESEKAAQYEAQMKQLVAEGTVDALDSVARRAPPLDEVKKAGGKVASTLGDDVATSFNSTGKYKASADTMVEYFVDRNAAGQEVVNARVVGKDGKAVVDDVQGAYRTLLTVKERMAAENDESRTYLAAQSQQESARHNSATEKQAAARDQASRADAAASRGIQMRKLALEEKSFKRQTPEGQIAEIERVAQVKLSPEEKKAFMGIKSAKGNKDADAVGAKIVESAVKTYQENTPNVTTAQIATFRANLERDMEAARGNIQVDNALKADLGGKDPGSPEYAKAWQEAQSIGLTDKDLQARGYKPPAKMVANPVQQVAATSGTARAPARAPAAAPKPDVIDLRADPVLASLNKTLATLKPNDPASIDQLMKIGTAKNARIEQLRRNYGSQTPLLTE